MRSSSKNNVVSNVNKPKNGHVSCNNKRVTRNGRRRPRKPDDPRTMLLSAETKEPLLLVMVNLRRSDEVNLERMLTMRTKRRKRFSVEMRRQSISLPGRYVTSDSFKAIINADMINNSVRKRELFVTMTRRWLVLLEKSNCKFPLSPSERDIF